MKQQIIDEILKGDKNFRFSLDTFVYLVVDPTPDNLRRFRINAGSLLKTWCDNGAIVWVASFPTEVMSDCRLKMYKLKDKKKFVKQEKKLVLNSNPWAGLLKR